MAPASSKEFLDIEANYRVWIHSETRTWHDNSIQSVGFLQCTMVISKIKYNFFLIWIFYYFGLKKSLFHVWRDEKKNTKTLNLFHVFHGCKKSKKSFTAVLTYIKRARFEASSTVLRKWEVSAGLQIYPKKILMRTRRAIHLKKAHRARR